MTYRRVKVEISTRKWYRRPLCPTKSTQGTPINPCH